MIIKENTIEKSKLNEAAMYALRHLDSMTYRMRDALPRGWNFILRSQGDAMDNFQLNVTADEGGGSFAEAKLNTLLVQPSLYATGQSPTELIPVVEKMTLNHDAPVEALQMLREHSALANLSKAEEVLLRDTCNITGFAGGVCVPFESLSFNDTKPVSGQFLVSFSGGTSEQDLFFGLNTFFDFIDKVRECYPLQNLHLNLNRLKEIPNVNFWLSLLRYQEF